MENSKVAETIFANTFISIERIRQAIEFLIGENEQYSQFGDGFIARIERSPFGIRIRLINTNTDKEYARLITDTEMESSNFDILTYEIQYMFAKLGYEVE